MMLPAGLAHTATTPAAWPILPLAGVLLATLNWTLGGLGSGRVHPVVATFLLLTFMYGPMMMPRHVLQRSRAGSGDLLKAVDVSRGSAGLSLSGTEFIQGGWLSRPQRPGVDATIAPPAAETLGSYTSGRLSPDRGWVTLEGLFRDRLPPLEDLSLGAQPGGIGTSSAIAVVIGGLFLLSPRRDTRSALGIPAVARLRRTRRRGPRLRPAKSIEWHVCWSSRRVER